MKTFLIAALLVSGVSFGGELAPTQKAVQKQAAQKSEPTQKSAFQKGESAELVTFRSRRAARRSCRRGSCG